MIKTMNKTKNKIKVRLKTMNKTNNKCKIKNNE